MLFTLIGICDCEHWSSMQPIMPFTGGSKKLAILFLTLLCSTEYATKNYQSTCPLSPKLPALIPKSGSFSPLPNLMKDGFEESLNLGFVILSKVLVIFSISAGLPYFDLRKRSQV